MVFKTIVLASRVNSRIAHNRGPDPFWKKRKIFKLAAHLYGRSRNCYTLAVRSVVKSMHFSTIGRKLKKLDMKELHETRINAGAQEHGLSGRTMMESLARCNILLNRRVLADLAIWEPRTFKCLADLARFRAIDEEFEGSEKLKKPNNVILRGLIDPSSK